jgi:hypothetical protein
MVDQVDTSTDTSFFYSKVISELIIHPVPNAFIARDVAAVDEHEGKRMPTCS